MLQVETDHMNEAQFAQFATRFDVVEKMVDKLGCLKATIATLAKQEADLKKQLSALGAGAYDGFLFRAVVKQFDRETLDMEAVRGKLSPQFISAHTNVVHVTTVCVNARV